MDRLRNGWFTEECEIWAGQKLSLKVKEVLHHEKTLYQDILIFQSEAYGKVLVLDGIIQCTEKDEFSYQEPITHLPLFSHPDPKKVLVIGGGDGGVLREVAKHSTVEEIHLCEIDKRVIELSKKFLPQLAVGFSSPKVKVHVMDGNIFLEEHTEEFDVIIVDSSDPIGPAECLFQQPFYEKARQALRPNGIMCAQGECSWLDVDVMGRIVDIAKGLYPVVGYAQSSVPTYPCGMIGYLLASKNKDTVFEQPLRRLSEEEAEQMNLKYYDSDVHTALFELPRYARKLLGIKQKS